MTRRWKSNVPRRRVVGGACLGLLLAHASCSSGSGGANACMAADENGVSGGTSVIDLTVTDTEFTVGSIDGGPGEPNITVENASTVTLTLINVGTKPHDFVIQCQPTPNTNGCPTHACFPAGADIPAVQPGRSATVTFVAPLQEGPYKFTSDVPGDTQAEPDGGVAGLVGQFVLM